MSQTSGSPGRYQRSFGGMVGAMVVLVVAVLVFVGLRAVLRDEPDVRREPVDYAASVRLAREADYDVVAPRSLPEGWIATSVDLQAGDRPRWGLGALTDEGRFVGVRQEDASADDLARRFLDEDAEEGDALTLDTAVADDWRSWRDPGGDVGYSAEVGEQTVLVYGSAGAEAVRELMVLLTD